MHKNTRTQQTPVIPKITGTLQLDVLEAHDLRRKGFKKMDPYCVIEFQGQKLTTGAHKKGHTDPKWDQMFQFKFVEADRKDQIHFFVYDKEPIKDARIGRADVSLAQLASLSRSSGECNLELIKHKHLGHGAKCAGFLRLSVKFTGNGWPADYIDQLVAHAQSGSAQEQPFAGADNWGSSRDQSQSYVNSNQSTAQSMGQSTAQSMGPSTAQSMGQSTAQSMGQSTSQPTTTQPSAGQV